MAKELVTIKGDETFEVVLETAKEVFNEQEKVKESFQITDGLPVYAAPLYEELKEHLVHDNYMILGKRIEDLSIDEMDRLASLYEKIFIKEISISYKKNEPYKKYCKIKGKIHGSNGGAHPIETGKLEMFEGFYMYYEKLHLTISKLEKILLQEDKEYRAKQAEMSATVLTVEKEEPFKVNTNFDNE